MSVGKNSLLCFKSNTRSISLASIGRWRDEDSFFEDTDQKNGDVEETRLKHSSDSSSESSKNEQVTSLWSLAVHPRVSELSSPVRLKIDAALANESSHESGAANYSGLKHVSSSSKISQAMNTLEAKKVFNFPVPIAAKHFSRERRNTYDLTPQKSTVAPSTQLRKRSSSGTDSDKLWQDLVSSANADAFDLAPNADHFLDRRRNSSESYTSTSQLAVSTRAQQEPIELLEPELGKSPDEGTSCLLAKSLEGLKMGYKPWQVDGCSGGTYYLRDGKGRFAGIFKPEDEESPLSLELLGAIGSQSADARTDNIPARWGLRKGVVPGEGAAREVLAYLLDHECFAGVPATTLVRLYSTEFIRSIMPQSPRHNQQHCIRSFQRSKSVDTTQCDSYLTSKGFWKTGSLQAYTSHNSSAEDVGYGLFPTDQVHRIGVMDVRLLNTDRHSGNMLLAFANESKAGCKEKVKLIPIDHGLCLPDVLNIDNDISFAWMSWPQAKEPFGSDVVSYVKKLDAEKDVTLVKNVLGERISRSSLLSLRVGSLLLKKGVEQGLTLYNIGQMICGKSLTLPLVADAAQDSLPESPLNQLIAAAAFVSLEEEEVSAFLSRLGSQFDLYMSDRANFAV